MSCNVSCISSYQCMPAEILDSAVKAPFVQIDAQSGEKTVISVGNNSSPSDNKAIIKSFEIAIGANGTGGTAEIYDEEGGSFASFVEKLSKTISKTSNDYTFKIDYGWIYKTCNNNVYTKKLSDYGPKLTYLLQKIQSSYDGGKIKFTLTFMDLYEQVGKKRIEDSEGTDDQKITLKDAIRNILKNNHPKINSVRFLRKEGKGTSEWKFKGEPDGPKKTWHSDQTHALAIIRTWLTGMLTERDKGITFGWNPESSQPELILWEDSSPGINESPKCCDTNIGTYIVNGGKCSNVISFSPSAEWIVPAKSDGGTPGGAATGGSAKPDDVKKSKKEGSGIQRIPTVSPSFFDSMSPDEIPKILQEFDQAQVKASTDVGEFTKQPIDAELRIIGEPKFSTPILLRGSTVSIIVLNPFNVKKLGNNLAWITNPVCNETWSNKGWQIMDVNHQISEGSFVTTLKVKLIAPNATTEPDKGLGCEGPTYDNAQPEE